jgi:hypothetical protein
MITCNRVSAKHSGNDDFAFLWEHAIFRHPPNENRLTDRSELLHTLIVLTRPVKLRKMVTIGWSEAVSHIGEL